LNRKGTRREVTAMPANSRPARRALGLAAVLGTSLLAPGVARADERPVPGCLGTNFEDPAGDARESPSGLEVTGGFLTVRDGTPVVNVTFADLDLEAYPQPDDIFKTVRVLYTANGRAYIVQATFSRLGPRSYQWGRDKNTSQPTRGAAHTGPDGVVEMELLAVKPGTAVSIGEIRTESYKLGGVEFGPDENMLRRTMDLAQGTTQGLACPAPAAPDPEPAASGSAPSSSEPPPVRPAPAPSEPAPAQPAGGSPAAQAAPPAARPPAPAARRRVTLRARRLRGAQIRLTGRTRGVRDGARVTLSRGGRVVARAVVRGGRYSATVRRVRRGTRLRARVDGLRSAPVRIS